MRIIRFTGVRCLSQSRGYESGFELMAVELQSLTLTVFKVSFDLIQLLCQHCQVSASPHFTLECHEESEGLRHLLKVTQLTQSGARICLLSKQMTA